MERGFRWWCCQCVLGKMTPIYTSNNNNRHGIHWNIIHIVYKPTTFTRSVWKEMARVFGFFFIFFRVHSLIGLRFYASFYGNIHRHQSPGFIVKGVGTRRTSTLYNTFQRCVFVCTLCGVHNNQFKIYYANSTSFFYF